MTAVIAPITDVDIADVALFLHTDLNARVPASAWAAAVDVPWKVDAPNRGFLVRDDGDVVGVYLAFYSDRLIGGRTERFCNLGAWCVRPAYRLHSLRMVKALLAQEGYHFTDLSPSGNVIALNTRLGFQFLDTATAMVLNLPWPSWPGRAVISGDPSTVQRTLSGDDLALFLDHRRTAAARHLVITSGDQTCYVVFRKDRRKNLPLFASLLYVSRPQVLARSWAQFSRHLLLRHGVLVTLAEQRVAAGRPWWSAMQRTPRRKMIKSAHLAADQIDYLYSELACVAW